MITSTVFYLSVLSLTYLLKNGIMSQPGTCLYTAAAERHRPLNQMLILPRSKYTAARCSMQCWQCDTCSKNYLGPSRQTGYTGLTALCPGLPGWAGTRKAKPIWISLKQETVSGSGISWAICKSAPRSRQITTPAPHRSVFLQAGCPSCRPTNSVKALKAQDIQRNY